MPLTYFPQPYSDETLYSLLGRYQRHCMYSNYQVNKELFDDGFTRHQLDIDQPDRLEQFCELTANALACNTPDAIVEKYTLQPYYSKFLNESDRPTILKRTPVIRSGTKGPVMESVPMYCPLCLTEMITAHGECYWKRAHQIPNILVCVTHQCFLERVSIDETPFGHIYVPSPKICRVSEPRFVKDYKILRIANLAAGALLTSDGLAYTKERIKETAISSGYVGSNRLIDWKGIVAKVEAHYGSELLEQYYKTIEGARFWLKYFLWKKHLFNPIANLLLIDFINHNTVSRFEERSVLENSADRWKCPNLAVDHFGKIDLVITKIHEKANQKKYFAECSCGWKIVEYENTESSKVLRRTVDYGDAWKRVLKQSILEGLSQVQIAKRLGIDASELRRRMKKINVTCDRWVIYRSRPRSKRTTIAERIPLKRMKLLSHVESSPGGFTPSLRQKQSRLCSWLLLHDRKWFKDFASRYAKKKITRGRPQRDDAALANEIRSVAYEFLSNPGAIRLTRRLLMSLVGLTSDGLIMCPIAAQMINSLAESRDKYKSRLLQNP